MSIFASRTIKVLEVPVDIDPEPNPATGAPHTVTIQRLAGRHLERAKQENMFSSVDTVKRIGVSFQKELAELGDKKKQEELQAEAKKDPLNLYDHYTVLRFGIKEWTYPESLTPVSLISESGVAVDRISAIDDLTDDARAFFAEQILRLSKPALFLDKDQQEAERKNVAASSSAA